MQTDEEIHLKITEQDGVCIVEFEDRKILEELSITQIGEELSRLVERKDGIRLLLNFRNVEHMSSAALGMLITLKKQVEDRGGRLMLCHISPQIFEVFRITQLYKLFEIHDTQAQALAAFARP